MTRLRSTTVGMRRSARTGLSPVMVGTSTGFGVMISQPTLSRITEQSSRLNAIIEQSTATTTISTPEEELVEVAASQSDNHNSNHRHHRISGETSLFLSPRPPATTPLPPPPSDTPATPSYLSLEQALKNNPSPKTPPMSKSKMPSATSTTGRFSTRSKTGPITPMKGGFDVPEGKGGFGFRSGLTMTGKKIVDGFSGMKASSPSTPDAPAPPTPMILETPPIAESSEADEHGTPRGSSVEAGRPKRKKRFSEIHREQFAKMDSIASHYAAKRTPTTTPNAPKIIAPEVTPKNALIQTPDMGLKNLKRAKCQSVLGEREPPSSPSPQKRRPDEVNPSGRAEDRSPVKRQRLNAAAPTLSSKPTKIARFAGVSGASSTPMKRAMFTPGGQSSALNAQKYTLPRPVPSLNLTPSTTFATPGRLRSTSTRKPPGTTSRLNTMINFAEASAATPMKTPGGASGGFTFRAGRGPSGLGFNTLTELHDRKAAAAAGMLMFGSRMGTPKVTENDPVGVEDPFATSPMQWDATTPVNNKRKMDSDQSSDEEMLGQTVQKKRPRGGEEEERKKRLDFLATPRKRIAGDGDRLGRRGLGGRG
ncbi:hypothetical protein DFP73DRAFT_351978 [Morchella snyderi]|nr:hypothetical protein DFP73DRAFT_351978 [Morchella snyderi]